MATALPFHRAVVRDPAFTDEPFSVHTRWIETEWDNTVPPFTAAAAAARRAEAGETVVVEVGGKRLEVSLPAGLRAVPAAPRRGRPPAAEARRPEEAAAAAGGDALTSPMQGTIVKIAVAEGTRSPRATCRGARGDEDGAAAQRAQGRRGDRPVGRRSATSCQPAR